MTAQVAYIDGATLASVLPPADAVSAVEAAFNGKLATTPLRHRHELEAGGELLLMPAWDGEGIGVKGVLLTPTGGVVGGWYMLTDPAGATLALFEAAALTAVRTAAVSVLATRLLARPDARRLLVFGAGTQARAHIRALISDRSISEVVIVSRTAHRAAALVEELSSDNDVPVRVGHPEDVRTADIVCTCTTSGDPLFDGNLLPAGTHLNAIGSHLPGRREVDATTVAKSVVVVETRAAALAEAGDLLLAEAEGRWRRDLLAGELSDVLAGAAGRASAQEITLFKSVGHAAEDLAVARAVHARLR